MYNYEYAINSQQQKMAKGLCPYCETKLVFEYENPLNNKWSCPNGACPIVGILIDKTFLDREKLDHGKSST